MLISHVLNVEKKTQFSFMSYRDERAGLFQSEYNTKYRFSMTGTAMAGETDLLTISHKLSSLLGIKQLLTKMCAVRYLSENIFRTCS